MPLFHLHRLAHWLEFGQGNRIVRVLCLIAFVVTFSAYLGYKRFHGPGSEAIFEEALVARNLAQGKGFSSSVIFPQAVAALERQQSRLMLPAETLPDLYHAPFYSAVLAGVLAVFGGTLDEIVWLDPIPVASGDLPAFNGDYFLLCTNIVLFWIACALTYWLGHRLFSARVGLISLLALLFSAGIWDGVLAVNGVVLLMDLFIIAFLLWSYCEKFTQEKISSPGEWRFPLLCLAIGMVLGLIFLTEYSAGLSLFGFLTYIVVRFRGRHLSWAMAMTLLGFLIISVAWCSRNIELTGQPLGLAGQNLALKAGDPTADPETVKSRFDPEGPPLSLRKVFNKGLKGLEENFSGRIWTGGAYLFSGFFLIGALYRFKRDEVNVLRWCALGLSMLLIAGQPFFNDGLSERLAAVYLAPLMIIFGVGFLMILIDSTRARSELEKLVWTAAVLGLHSLPLVHNLAEPRRLPFTYPPYHPSVMALTRTLIMDNVKPGYAFMADVPAGVAWYSQQPVWAQPETYSGYAEALLHQDIAALFLSPKVLDQPYFSQLLKPGFMSGAEISRSRTWSAVYANLLNSRVPHFFPLQRVFRLTENMYVLINPMAEKTAQLRY